MHIFEPLGMTATYNSTEAAITGQRVKGFMRVGRNLTRCAELWQGGTETVDESCLGELGV